MISPLTPSGTKIVCDDDKSLGLYNKQTLPTLAYDLHGLKQGQTYTVLDIQPYDLARSGYTVILREITRPEGSFPLGYDLGRFSLANGRQNLA